MIKIIKEQQTRKIIILTLLFIAFLFFISCDKKTTEPEDWDPYGLYFGPLKEGNNSTNFEYFYIFSSDFSAKGIITFIDGFEFFEETITLSGDVNKEGNGYVLTGSFLLTIEDDEGYAVYSATGTVTGELHYDSDMPFPVGSGSGTTEDGQITISWNIFKSQ